MAVSGKITNVRLCILIYRRRIKRVTYSPENMIQTSAIISITNNKRKGDWQSRTRLTAHSFLRFCFVFRSLSICLCHLLLRQQAKKIWPGKPFIRSRLHAWSIGQICVDVEVWKTSFINSLVQSLSQLTVLYKDLLLAWHSLRSGHPQRL